MFSKNKIGFWGILYITIIVLKFTSYVTWSWWIILLPFYFPICLFIFILPLGIIILGKQEVVKIWEKHWNS